MLRILLFSIFFISFHSTWGKSDSPDSLLEKGEGDTAMVFDKMGNGTVMSIDNIVDALPEQSFNDELIETTGLFCAFGYVKVGSRLCLSSHLYGPIVYRYAEYYCRQKHSGGRIADHADYYTVYQIWGNTSFHNYARRNLWLGPRTADNRALYLNLVRYWDMDGEGSVFDYRYYRCAYDL
jgi:hypothetical protein